MRKPILLNGSLQDYAFLHPSKANLNLRMCGVSECTMTLAPDSMLVPMHGWVKIYTHKGLAGVFRRTSNNVNVLLDDSITLRHGIDILADSIWPEEIIYDGTVTGFLTALLGHQTALVNGAVPWELGVVDDGAAVYQTKIKFQTLLALLQGMEDEGGDYYFSYDMSSFPWRVSYLRRETNVSSEFRLSRNIQSVRISENDSELCTRLYLQVNGMVTSSKDSSIKENSMVLRTYNNESAQAIYGVITRTEDIDTSDQLPNGPFPEADAYAAKYLAGRAAPITTVSIDGAELIKLTGNSFDESRIAALCRVALPDQQIFLAERVSAVSYPDLYGMPEKVTVTLSNANPKRLREMSLTEKVEQNKLSAKAAGGAARGSARLAESFQQHFQITDKNNNILKQAGLILDANGMLVYADDNVNMVGARFNVQADQIGMVVGTRDGVNFIKAGEIALSINATSGESTALIDADHINISGTTTAYTLAGDLEHDANGRLVIKNAGGLYCARTKDGVTAYFGVWDTGNLTGGVMVDKINTQGGTQTKLTLQADVIDINGLISALESNAGWFTYFDGYQGSFTGELTVGGLLDAQGGLRTTNVEMEGLTVGEYAATWKEAAVATGVTVTFPAYTFTARKAFGYFNEDGSYAGRLAGSLVTTTDVTGSVSVATTTLYYLGRTASSGT